MLYFVRNQVDGVPAVEEKHLYYFQDYAAAWKAAKNAIDPNYDRSDPYYSTYWRHLEGVEPSMLIYREENAYLFDQLDKLAEVYIPVEYDIFDKEDELIGKHALDKELLPFYKYDEEYCYTDQRLADLRKESEVDGVAHFINGELIEII